LGRFLQSGCSLLSKRDKDRLTKVHPHLALIVAEASVEFPKKYPNCSLFVIYGIRDRLQQYTIWRECHNHDGTPNGEPWKTNLNGTPKGQRTPEGSPGTGVSRHQSGYAVDLGVNHAGKLTWDKEYYDKLAAVMLEIGARHKLPLHWGGSFKRYDGPHFELNAKFYP
jgi:hypothetical protein